MALRARWLAESLPLSMDGDAPQAAALLERFSSLGFNERVQVMHRLLRRYRLELPRAGYTPRYDYAGMPVPMDGMPITLRPIR